MDDFPDAADLAPHEDDEDLQYEQQFHDEIELMRQLEPPVPSPGAMQVKKREERPEDRTARRALFAEVGTGVKRARESEAPRGESETLRRDKRHKPDEKEMADATLEQRLGELRSRRAAARRELATAAAPQAPAPHCVSLRVPRWPFATVTRDDGARLYVRLEAGLEPGTATAAAGADLAAHLASMYKDAWTEAALILERRSSASDTAGPEVGQAEAGKTQLWVEQYRPREYAELVSDEATNRAVLHWLKLWDKVVMRREVCGAGEEELDKAGAPRRRVLLLAGPPGSGKTTLAALLARHAGYRALQVNSADERGATALAAVLRDATRMQSVLHADRRPNCIILDEFDGAPQPTVELLVKAVSGSDAPPRPVICICDDLWTPTLRPLRSIACVVQARGADCARLAARLGEVAAREGVRTHPAALAAIAARAAGDLRAALATLQLLAGTSRDREVRLCDVERAGAAGARDSRAGVLAVLRLVLTPPPPAPSAATAASVALLRAVAALNDYDRLSEGVQEQLARARSVSVCAGVLAALCWAERVLSHVARAQLYALLPHAPPVFLRCRRLLAAPALSRSRLAFPTRHAETRRARERACGVVEAVLRGAAPALRPHLSRASLALDLLPLLPRLLAAPRSHLAAARDVERAARVMCDFSLAYQQSALPEGGYTYTLQPDVHLVACFHEAETRPRTADYAALQTLSRAARLEAMRRAELKCDASAPARTPAAAPAPAPLPNHMRRLEPLTPARAAAPSVGKDMFGRVVRGGGAQLARDAGAAAWCSLYYHYREGYNNAVRRSVKLHNLL